MWFQVTINKSLHFFCWWHEGSPLVEKGKKGAGGSFSTQKKNLFRIALKREWKSSLTDNDLCVFHNSVSKIYLLSFFLWLLVLWWKNQNFLDEFVLFIVHILWICHRRHVETVVNGWEITCFWPFSTWLGKKIQSK